MIKKAHFIIAIVGAFVGACYGSVVPIKPAPVVPVVPTQEDEAEVFADFAKLEKQEFQAWPNLEYDFDTDFGEPTKQQVAIKKAKESRPKEIGYPVIEYPTYYQPYYNTTLENLFSKYGY